MLDLPLKLLFLLLLIGILLTHIQWRYRWKGNKILVGMVVKSNLGDLEDEVRELFYIRLRKDFNGVVQLVSVKRRLFVRFHGGCEKDLNLDQLSVVTVDKFPMTKEAEVPTISAITDKTVDLEKG